MFAELWGVSNLSLFPCSWFLQCLKAVVAPKPLDTRAPALFLMFLIPDLVVLSLCHLSRVFPKVKPKPAKAKLCRAVSGWFPTMVAHGTAPDWGVRKHKLGDFGPGSEIGTGWRAGLGSWASSRVDMGYKQVWVCPQVTSDCTVGLSVQQHPGLPPAPEGSRC